MADFNSPTTSDSYTSILSTLRQNVSDIITFLDGSTDSNLPNKAKRYNTSAEKFEKWNGSAWATLGFHTPIDAHIAATGAGSIHETRLPGEIVAYGGGSAPSGWLLCDGTAVSRTTYAALFAIVGTSYGVGNGSTTFNLPDLRQRFPLGKAASGTGNTLGATGGAIDHTHSVPNHTHAIAAHQHDMGNHTHTGGAHSHTLNDHTHKVKAHYHSAAGSGATINITASGEHVHQISTQGGGSANMNFSSTYRFGRCDAGAGSTFQYGNTDFNSSGGGQGVGPTHTHPHSSFAGTVGNVTSGNDGDASLTETDGVTGGAGSTQSGGAVTSSTPSTNNTSSVALNTNTDGGSTTGSNNPPYQVVNYIIHT